MVKFELNTDSRKGAIWYAALVQPVMAETKTSIQGETKQELDLIRQFAGNLAESPGTVGALLIGAIYTAMKLRRRISRDTVEVVQDRQQVDLLAAYHKDREIIVADRNAAQEESKKAWTAHNVMAVENATLKSQNGFYMLEIAGLKELIKDLRESMEAEQARHMEERERLQRTLESVSARLQSLAATAASDVNTVSATAAKEISQINKTAAADASAITGLKE